MVSSTFIGQTWFAFFVDGFDNRKASELQDIWGVEFNIL